MGGKGGIAPRRASWAGGTPAELRRVERIEDVAGATAEPNDGSATGTGRPSGPVTTLALPWIRMYSTRAGSCSISGPSR